MTHEELAKVIAPFHVRCTCGCREANEVLGFNTDPVTGAYTAAYFRGSGWLLTAHLLRGYELISDHEPDSPRAFALRSNDA